MRRTTVYIPDTLAIKLKVYAARRREDVSGIITKQIELLLAGPKCEISNHLCPEVPSHLEKSERRYTLVADNEA